MKRVSISEAKNRLSALIDGLKNGSPVLIVDRGRPVARLEPIGNASVSDGDGLLARLIRDGVVRPGNAKPIKEVLPGRRPRPKRDGSVLRTLLQRTTGRPMKFRRPASMPLVTLDDRLALAARKDGFLVLS